MPNFLDTLVSGLAHVPPRRDDLTIIGVPAEPLGPPTLVLTLLALIATFAVLAGLAAV
jgi:hypothetical protein